jgi:hypothetical protein
MNQEPSGTLMTKIRDKKSQGSVPLNVFHHFTAREAFIGYQSFFSLKNEVFVFEPDISFRSINSVPSSVTLS